MPRQNRRRSDEHPDRRPITALGEHHEDWRGMSYAIRAVTGNASGRAYRCPGCDHEIRGGNHVVAWPAHDPDAADRRHWHTVCWAARERRSPGIVRARSAPRH